MFNTSKKLHRPSASMVVSFLALFVALGGSGYAALRLPANSVGSRQLKSDAVTGAKVKDNSLFANDFAPGQIPHGPQGPQGPQGSQGPQGLAGAQGIQGTPGTASAKGDKGDPGPIGPAGSQGLRGDPGPIGPAGPQGLRGLAGFGIQGPAGPQGPQGDDGPVAVKYVTAQGVIKQGQPVITQTASCDFPQNAIGGGVHLQLHDGHMTLNESYPVNFGTGWRATVIGDQGGQTFDVYAICTKPTSVDWPAGF
jgi:hypothetical protein